MGWLRFAWPLRVSLAYVLLSILWIVISDRLLALLIQNQSVLTTFQNLKGTLFVVVTGLLLYLALARAHRQHAQVEAALRESEGRFRRAFFDAPFPIMIHADDGAVIQMNQIWSEITGYTVQDIPTITEWTAQAYRQQPPVLHAEVDNLYQLDRRIDEGDFLVTTRSGQQRTWAFSSAPLGSLPDGRRLVISMAMDITERKTLEAQLLQSQKMESIGQLAGGIAHDFNNLLTAIRGYTELALVDLPEEELVRADLSEIQQAAVRAETLTRQLLAFARRQRMEMRSLDLNKLLQNLEKLLRRLIGEDIRLVIHLAPDLWPVVADAGQIEQTLINLAVNARDAMPEGGTLSIATANVHLDTSFTNEQADLQAGAYVLLKVSDTGVGIPTDIQQHLFEPFFTTKPVGRGTGLGLATCYGIIKQHSGAIRLSSEIGHGTEFKIYLPKDMTRETELAPPRLTVSDKLPRGTETVLLVEDEPTVRALAVRVLRECGYTVLEAGDGTEAVQVASRHAPQPIHLLLSDVVMPHMGGPAVAAQIRDQYPNIVTLFISGYTGINGRHLERHTLDTPLLQKPFTPSDLAITVRATLDRSATTAKVVG